MTPRLAAVAVLALAAAIGRAADPPAPFARDNLVAWCVVPFDAKRRGPDERAAMLRRLGFRRFAYDWRDQHLPTFEAELAALKREGIRLDAVWFPAGLNREARFLLDALAKHNVKPQLWVTLTGGRPTADPAEQAKQVDHHAAALRPVVEAAAAVGCTVGLYNHGGWFGEPENQLAVRAALGRPNVGLVYNLHHGHDHLDRFPELLRAMRPHLLALNLNGMVAGGDRVGRKILPLGQGDRDLALLKAVVASGYRGPVGILGHTDDDAEERLRDNLDGLDWLVPQLAGRPPGPKPVPRTGRRP
jgi:sugar phosphate isomerase/epimerase